MLASMMQPCIFLQLLALHQFHKYRAGHNSQQFNTAQTGTEHPALANVNTEETKWKHSLWAEWPWQCSVSGSLGTKGGMGLQVWNCNSSYALERKLDKAGERAWCSQRSKCLTTMSNGQGHCQGLRHQQRICSRKAGWKEGIQQPWLQGFVWSLWSERQADVQKWDWLWKKLKENSL